MWKMQVTWELFEIAKGLTKTSQNKNVLASFFKKTCLYSSELISFDYLTFKWINIISLLPESPVYFFSFHIKIIPLKFNQGKNLKLLTWELITQEF